MKIYDSHVHIFTPKIVENVINQAGLVQRVALKTENINNRLTAAELTKEMQAADVRAALMLPTADMANVVKVNRNCIQTARKTPGLFTAGTLHPDFKGVEAELDYLSRASVRVIKLCSFSQGFSLNNANTHKMFGRIQAFNRNSETSFAVVLDTFTLADRYFGTNPAHTTTPEGLTALARLFPDINFIGAHMGGLAAPFERLIKYLVPLPNLYLDTSNASHTLSTDEFVRMLQQIGSGHILFGTDWPWFLHAQEVVRIDSLMEKAGFSKPEKEAVFFRNLERLADIGPEYEGT